MTRMASLSDSDLMPYGKYKDTPMGEVPADYLLWLYENNKVNGHVARYIEENLDTLKMQIANSKKGIR